MTAGAAEIVFRADAAVQIGLGHLKRCLSLAHALRVRGARCRFLTRESDVRSCALVVSEGFEACALPPWPAPGSNDATEQPRLAHATWLGGAQRDDAAATVELLRQAPPRWLVADHYALDARWHRAVSGALGCRLAAIDDLADRELAVELLIDHNQAPDHRAKYRACLPPAATVLGGPGFALLAPQYARATPPAVHEQVRSIGIFMGGTDAGGLALLALRACMDAGLDGPIEIAATSACPHLAALQALAAARPASTVSVDLPELSGFFGRHGLQIGAGGGATWERCCLGAPTIALVAAANQRHVLAPIEALGVLAIADEAGPPAGRLVPTIRRLLDDHALRRALAQRARLLVDGGGAGRVADALLSSAPAAQHSA